MDDAPILLPADLVRVGVERPLRMAVDTPPRIRDDLLSASEPLFASAVPSYATPASFDWRRDTPLAGPAPAPSDA